MSNSDNYHYSLPSKHWCPAANTKYLQPFTEKVLTIILPLNYRLCLTINLRNLKLLSMFYMTSYKIHFHYLVTDIMLCWANLPGLSWNSLPQNSVNIHTHTHTHTQRNCLSQRAQFLIITSTGRWFLRKHFHPWQTTLQWNIQKALQMPISHDHNHKRSLPSVSHNYNFI